MTSFYVIAPDIREGITLPEYRRNRPARPSIWRRMFGRIG